ncbi:MAG: hypothetical protein MUF45_01695 [Spirosomaceae bacterium]|jgi:hypothetical protein|nr:hypothetical protein [Spirosomataceae bacterium]
MKKLKLTTLVIFLMTITSACKEESIEPTGGLKITLGNNFSETGYQLYPNPIYIGNGFFPSPIKSGVVPQFNGAFVINLSDLNEGTYILVIRSLSYYVQVTKGKVREYRFD